MNMDQLALLKRSVREWNTFREENPNAKIDLSGADLGGAELSGADLNDANLRGGSLIQAKLQATKLRRSDLTGANLSGAFLLEAYLVMANFFRANLTGADLRSANLNQANLDTADLTGAAIGFTSVGRVDLSRTKGLADVLFFFPSSVGVDTILMSGGMIPHEFLRGCGFDPLVQRMLVGDGHSKTEAFTEWVSLRHNPLQRCFISFATEDKPFADRLQKSLNESGIDYWYAPEHGIWGEYLQDQIAREIAGRDRMLLVCSEASLKKDWVLHEIELAIEQEKKRNAKVIFPIMIDHALLTWKDPIATRIRKVLAADFIGATEGDAFKEKLPRLLKALG